jgi:PAS domain S-box-containing protein
MREKSKSKKELLREIEELRLRLDEAEQVLRGIQSGEVDALILAGPEQERVYTLEGANQPYQVLVETMNEGALTLAADGTILYCNPRFAEMIKIPIERIIGRSIGRFVARADKQKLASLIEGSQKERLTAEISLKSTKGTFVHSHFSLVPLELDGLQSICGVVTDLTGVIAAREASLRLEDTLMERERLLSLINTNVSDLIWLMVVEPKNRYRCVAVSGSYIAVTGLREDQVVGKWLREILPAAPFNFSLAKYQEAIRAGETIVYEESADVPAGHIVLETRLTPIFDPRENCTYLLGVSRDATERKRTEEQLRQLSACLLEAQDQERRRIARELHDSTAHDLAAIAINLSRLEECAELDEGARKCLADTVSLAKQSSGEIRNLSYLLHPPLLDERGLDSALRWYTDGFAQRSGIATELDMPAKIGRLPQEIETALFRIVQEGLTNIHRHSSSPTARIRLLRSSAGLVLEVQDEGHGMPRDTFKETRGTIEGMGVGIAGMRERLRQLGGRLEIDTNSHGTIVRATLPLSKGQS